MRPFSWLIRTWGISFDGTSVQLNPFLNISNAVNRVCHLSSQLQAWKQNEEAFQRIMRSGKLAYQSAAVSFGLNISRGETTMVQRKTRCLLKFQSTSWLQAAWWALPLDIWVIGRNVLLSKCVTLQFCRYQGEWQGNKRTGFGVYSWADGTKYEGEWDKDTMQGCGRAVFPSGDPKEGQFVENKYVGAGLACPVESVNYSVEEARDAARRAQKFSLDPRWMHWKVSFESWLSWNQLAFVCVANSCSVLRCAFVSVESFLIWHSNTKLATENDHALLPLTLTVNFAKIDQLLHNI